METQTAKHSHSQLSYLQNFIELLVEKYRPLRVVCFGRTSSTKQNIGCFMEPWEKEHCHHFLLMVTESATRIEHEVQDFANGHFLDLDITIIVHGQKNVEAAIEANSRFYCTVFEHGELLYKSDGLFMERPVSYVAIRAEEKAREHMYNRIPLAHGFITGATKCIEEEQFNVSVFMLHQAVEQCCIALIRIFIGYRSDVHNLYRLLRLCASFSSMPSQFFLNGNKDDEELFDVLVKSYSAARYNDSFDIEPEIAGQLLRKVSTFFRLAKRMCKSKVEQLEREALSDCPTAAESGDQNDE